MTRLSETATRVLAWIEARTDSWNYCSTPHALLADAAGINANELATVLEELESVGEIQQYEHGGILRLDAGGFEGPVPPNDWDEIRRKAKERARGLQTDPERARRILDSM